MQLRYQYINYQFIINFLNYFKLGFLYIHQATNNQILLQYPKNSKLYISLLIY